MRRGAQYGLAPLANARFFADVDLLPGPNEPNHNTPFRDPFGELNEVLGFGLSITLSAVCFGDLSGIECPLCLVEDQDVLRRHEPRPR